MTTFNGLLKSWDSFIHGICAKKKLIKFIQLWEECTQEEARLLSREENMGDNDDQALIAHAKKDRRKREDQTHKRHKRFHNNHRSKHDFSPLRCYTCDEKRCFARDCPRNKGSSRINKRRKHHAHLAEEDEPKEKGEEKILQVMKNMF